MSVRRRAVKQRVARARAFQLGNDEMKLGLEQLRTALDEAKAMNVTHITAEWLANKLAEIKARS